MPSTSMTRRIAISTTVLLVLALVVGVGPAAAHTPSCIQTAGDDGPHYDGEDGTQTASQTAFEQNPTLGGAFNGAVDSCSVGNSQAPQSEN